jgi:hypothetical protein
MYHLILHDNLSELSEYVTFTNFADTLAHAYGRRATASIDRCYWVNDVTTDGLNCGDETDRLMHHVALLDPTGWLDQAVRLNNQARGR